MSILSPQVTAYLDRSSWIRKMFETGAELKARHGADAVCDFSLGNPDLPPPAVMVKAMHELAEQADKPMFLGYMPNFGYPHLRESLSKELTREQGVKIGPEDICVTCGAAGAINAFYRAVIAPGEEVIAIAPFFVEYAFYVENHGGTLKPVNSNPEDFSLDLDAVESAITDKTRAIIINSPNNPTGAVYTKSELEGLAALLTKHSEGRERPIFLLSDEPYRFLAYDGTEVPSVLPLYPYSIVASSFSKNLSMAGARVGYALLNPDMPGKEQLMHGIVLANRILGFVNAPSLGQKLLHMALGSQVDASIYDSRRKAMAEVLDNAGVEYAMPKGAFYFFPKAPGGDDVEFCNALQEELILAVPGRGFGYPGYVRLAFCIDEEVIRRSRDGFKKAVEKFNG